MKIALVGNPNSGKTSVFNCLTGTNQKIGNWPGVTIEKKDGYIKGSRFLHVIDLPGIYSMNTISKEEHLTKKFLLNEAYDLIINIIDLTNLERSLYLTTQLIELEKPMILLLNMWDLAKKKGLKIDYREIQSAFDCQTILFSAQTKKGLEEVMQFLQEANYQRPRKHNIYNKELEIIINAFKGDLESRLSILNRIESRSEYALNQAIKNLERNKQDEIESIIAQERYVFIAKININKENVSAKTKFNLDDILLNKYLAFPVFGLIMFLVYYLSLQGIGRGSSVFVGYFIDGIVRHNLEHFLVNISASQALIRFISDGLIGGVGAVLSFLPQLIVMFFFISLLESSGYMSRVAFMLDKVFWKIGLSGKTIIPLILGTGCSVPGIMATRIIEKEEECQLTISLVPFIPCSAKLPVFALLIGAFFPDNILIAPLLYFIAIFVIFFSGWLLQKLIFNNQRSDFCMELPNYKVPNLNYIFYQIYENCRNFFVRAGTVIFLASGIIWLLQHFSFSLSYGPVDESILAYSGRALLPFFRLFGVETWEVAVSVLSGIIAKEQIVASLEILSVDVNTSFTALSALSFMVFVLVASPCISALSTMRKELKSLKKTFWICLYQTSLAFLLAILIFQIGSIIL
ncbi:MAG: ferrous iron transport protein B [Erysipelotrichales bacterium]|nr:ferrous iron transport protein B [Erysipelotrichales bacterium]